MFIAVRLPALRIKAVFVELSVFFPACLVLPRLASGAGAQDELENVMLFRS